MEWIIISIVIALLFLFFIASSIYQEHLRIERIYEQVRNNYGVTNKETISVSELNNIAKYHNKLSGTVTDQFLIDQITWNDLSLDDVYMQMNQTLTSVGEEYLYHRLHCMEQDRNDQDYFYHLINYMDSHPDQRFTIQKALLKLGKVKRYSITDIICLASTLKQESNFSHFLMDFALLVAVGLVFVHAGIGILLVILMLAVNIISYFKRKPEVTPYFTTFGYIVKLIQTAKELVKLKDSEFTDVNNRLDEIIREFRPFCNSSRLLVSGVKSTQNPFEIILDYLRMIFHLDIIRFNFMLQFMQNHIEMIEELRTIIGKYDAAIAIASYRNSLPYYCIPEFHSSNELVISDGYHPLIEAPISNSITTYGSVLITGSNASGKSTFLRMVAISAILAQSLGFVPARKYSANRYRLLTSMALKDNLQQNESYFMVEIKSLKRIVDLANSDGCPIICVIDEVLRGTNTVERIAASSRILKDLSMKQVKCFAATHDIELAEILKDYYTNYHFDEEIVKNDVIFNYRIKSGKSTTRNAIKLLSVIGYDSDLISQAEEDANAFLIKNQWNPI